MAAFLPAKRESILSIFRIVIFSASRPSSSRHLLVSPSITQLRILRGYRKIYSLSSLSFPRLFKSSAFTPFPCPLALRLLLISHHLLALPAASSPIRHQSWMNTSKWQAVKRCERRLTERRAGHLFPLIEGDILHSRIIEIHCKHGFIGVLRR